MADETRPTASSGSAPILSPDGVTATGGEADGETGTGRGHTEGPDRRIVHPQAIATRPTRSAANASRAALAALILRDLTVLRKNFGEFVGRTLVQPFLLVFVFLYVFPEIGQGIGGGQGSAGASEFATVLVPGVIGITIMFQGIQAVALQLSQEFGYTREIEDRVQAPCPIQLVALSKVLSGAVQGMISALIVFPIAAVVHARGVHADLTLHWWIVVTLIPLACLAMTSLGLLLGTTFEARNIGLMFGFVVLPLTFLGGTYYQWTKLAPVQVGGFHWLQALVLLNPLIYITEGMRAALTQASHMPLYVVYPVLIGFLVLFLGLGLRNFRRKVLS
jgi:ABC-2 type transport system permease protein